MLRKTLSFVAVSLLIGGVSALSCAQTIPQTQVLNRVFARGGRVEMHLQAGEYQIRRCVEDKIHVEWTADSSKLAKVRVDLSTDITNAKLKIRTPSNGHVHVIIEVPATTNLYVRMTAGDLNVEGIEGDKDIASHAGDVNIDVGDPASYDPVDASVNIGDLTAEAFNISKEGFHNTLHLNGGGRYTLRTHVGVGDLRLSGKKKEAA
jgi:putative adhesin